MAGALVLEDLLLELGRPARPPPTSTSACSRGPRSPTSTTRRPTMRSFGDVDILVRVGRLRPGRPRCSSSTGPPARSTPSPAPAWTGGSAKGISFRTSGRPRARPAPDLRHWARSASGSTSTTCGASAEPFTVGDQRRARAASRELRLLNACYHAVLGDTVAAAGRRCATSPSWRCTRELDVDRCPAGPRQRPARRCVAAAVRHAWHALRIADVTALSAWAAAATSRPSGRRPTSRSTRTSGSSETARAFAELRVLPSTHRRVRVLWALARADRGAGRRERPNVGAAAERPEPQLHSGGAVSSRVLWLTKGLGRGGAEMLLTTTAAHLDEGRSRIEVAYLLPAEERVRRPAEPSRRPVHCLQAGATSTPAGCSRLRRLLRDGDYDLVHTHSPLVGRRRPAGRAAGRRCSCTPSTTSGTATAGRLLGQRADHRPQRRGDRRQPTRWPTASRAGSCRSAAGDRPGRGGAPRHRPRELRRLGPAAAPRRARPSGCPGRAGRRHRRQPGGQEGPRHDGPGLRRRPAA